MTYPTRNRPRDDPPALDRWLAIVGIGADGVESLSASGRQCIANADHVFGGARHLKLARTLTTGEEHIWPSPIADAVAMILSLRGRNVAVLASGDPNHFGIGSMLANTVGPDERICYPAPSSFSLAAARLAWPLQDIDTLSACGRPLAAIVPYLQPGRRLLVLSGDGDTPAEIAALLVGRGFGASRVHILEMLGAEGERVRQCAAEACELVDIDPLNVVGIEVAAGPESSPLPIATGLPDEYFETDGQLTKREVRAVTLSSLEPHPGELLWDIGTASGSIAIEWMLRHKANRAIGIEPRQERLERAMRNAISLGVPGFQGVSGEAPGALEGLAAPDAVFIGGGLKTAGLIERAWDALPLGGRIVANSVTIEGLSVLLGAIDRFGGSLVRLSVERLDTLGTMRGLRPALPVTQWKAVKP